MPAESQRNRQMVYIHAAHRATWAEAEKIAERLYGPRQLSRYVSEALAERNERERAQS